MYSLHLLWRLQEWTRESASLMLHTLRPTYTLGPRNGEKEEGGRRGKQGKKAKQAAKRNFGSQVGDSEGGA